METICQQCGDKGFEDLFVYCVKCLNFAVHCYCLPDIPQNFDKLTSWFCDDCEPKSTKQSPPEKPCSIPSMESDTVISKNVKAVHSKIRSKKQDATCFVAETEEHRLSCDLKMSNCVASNKKRHQSRPVCQPELNNRIALADSIQLVGDPVISKNVKAVHPKINSKKQDVTRRMVETEEHRLPTDMKASSCVATEEKRHQLSPVCQPESNNRIALADSKQLVGDPVIPGSVKAVHPKINMKKQDVTFRVEETEEHRLPADLKASSVAATEKKRHRRSPVCEPKSNKRIALADSTQLVGDPVISESVKAVHPKIKSKKQDVTCRVVETEERRLPCDLKMSGCEATEEEKRHRLGPVCQPESINRIALADSSVSTQLVGDPVISKSVKAVHPKIKPKKQEVICRVVETGEHRLPCDLKASSCAVTEEEKRRQHSPVCKPKPNNRIALADSRQLVGDPVISDSVKAVNPKNKSKKEDVTCRVVETDERRLPCDLKASSCVATEKEKKHQPSPVCQLESKNIIALADSTQLVGDPVISEGVKAVHPKTKSKKEDVACRVVETEERRLPCDLKESSYAATKEEKKHQPGPVCQPESNNRIALDDSTQLVGDPAISESVKAVHPKTKSKKQDVTCRVVETEECRLPCDLKASSCAATEEEKRHRHSPVCQPESNNRIALADSTQLVGDPVISESVKAVHPKTKSKKQDVTCGVVETEERRLTCDLKVSSYVATEEEKKHPPSPVCQLESNNTLADSTQLVGDPAISESVKAAHPKTKLKKQDVTCRVVETKEYGLPANLKASSCTTTEEEKRHWRSPVCQPESDNRIALADSTVSTQLVGDPVISKSVKAVHPKIKSKKQYVTCRVGEIEEHRLSRDLKASSCAAAEEEKGHPCNPVPQPVSNNKIAQAGSTQLVGACSLKSKLNMRKDATQTVVKTRNQRKGSVSSCRNGFTERVPLAGGRPARKHKLKRRKKYVKPSVAEREKQKHPNPTWQPYKAHTEPSGNKRIHFWSEDLENDVALGRRRRLTLEDGLEDGSVLSKMARTESIRITDSRTASGDLSVLGAHNYQLAQPVVNPIWRGSFNTRNRLNGFFEGIAAHLSSKACPMVCEAAESLPGLICLEMLPKTAVWPKSFQKSEPCDDNIALYFFPLNKRYESVFDHLVGVMREQELALRGTVRHAELLIFTSCELPILYWRFQGKYYLWGVFRAKQASSSHPVNVTRITHSNPYGAGNGERNLRSPRIW